MSAFWDLEAISKELVRPVCPTSWQSPLNTVEKTFKGLSIYALPSILQIKKQVCMTENNKKLYHLRHEQNYEKSSHEVDNLDANETKSYRSVLCYTLNWKNIWSK